MTKQLVIISPPGQRLKLSPGEGSVTSAQAPDEPHNYVIVEGEAPPPQEMAMGGDPPPPPPDWGMTMRGDLPPPPPDWTMTMRAGLPDDVKADHLAGFETTSRISFADVSERLKSMPANGRKFIVMRG